MCTFLNNNTSVEELGRIWVEESGLENEASPGGRWALPEPEARAEEPALELMTVLLLS